MGQYKNFLPGRANADPKDVPSWALEALRGFEFEIHAADTDHTFRRKADPFDRFCTVIWLSLEGDPPFVSLGFDDVEKGHPPPELSRSHLHFDIIVSVWKGADAAFQLADEGVHWEVMNRGAWRHRIFYKGKLVIDYPGVQRKAEPVVSYVIGNGVHE